MSPTERPNLDGLVTESVSDAYAELDTMSVFELVGIMNEADATVAGAVAAARHQITAAVEAVADRVVGGGRLFYVGAGTAGRLGVLDAAECPPTFGTPPELVQAAIAGGPGALLAAVEGAEDDAAAGADQIRAWHVTAADAVVGIAASGRTPYVIGAMDEARRRGAVTASVSCNRPAEVSSHVDHPIEVVVGPEVVAGSTRLKAGTAQKMVLNMISTATMVRLGKTYQNLMVDLVTTNAKLEERALRMVCRATGQDRSVAEAALGAAGGHVKVAVLMVRAAVDADEAEALLQRSGGHLRAALQLAGVASDAALARLDPTDVGED